MPRDLIAEMALIDLSRQQRETLERWMRVCIDAGEPDTAEEVRRALSVKHYQWVLYAA